MKELSIPTTGSDGTGSSEKGPDLSIVFAKLSEMRQSQHTAFEALKKSIDDVVDATANEKLGLEKLQEDVLRMDRLQMSHLDSELDTQKSNLQHGLHVQEQLVHNIHDWVQRISTLKKHFEKTGLI